MLHEGLNLVLQTVGFILDDVMMAVAGEEVVVEVEVVLVKLLINA
jgi:hypothetical protein